MNNPYTIRPATQEDPHTWRTQAPCANRDADLWFSTDDRNRNKALTICRTSCPVRTECLTDALTHNEGGIWGGLTERALNQRRNQQAA